MPSVKGLRDFVSGCTVHQSRVQILPLEVKRKPVDDVNERGHKETRRATVPMSRACAISTLARV